jgi:TolB-like protein
MKKSYMVITGLLLVVFLLSPTAAQQVKKVAVLPFQMNSPEKLDYLRDGVWDMLMSRIEVSNKIEVIGKPSVLNALDRVKKKQMAEPDVLTLGEDLKVDYVVWGSITKIGENVSLDGKLLDVAAKKSAVSVFEQSQGLNEVIPKINDFAKKIDQHILGDVPASFAAAPAAPVGAPTGGAATAAGGAAVASTGIAGVPQSETEVISGMRKGKGTYTAAINPDFIHSGRPDDRRGFWMSPKYGTEFRGMDIGDVNKDGLNEVVIIDVNNVMIYQKKGNEFLLLNKIAGRKGEKYLSVDVADINGNGIPEIFVTNFDYDHLESFVLEYRDGKYEKIASGLRWFMRVINTGETPVLLCQELSIDPTGYTGSLISGAHFMFRNPIHEAVWSDGKYREGSRMKIPEGLPVYGLTLDTIEPGKPERVVCLDDFDYLRVYEKTDKLLQKLSVFGGAPEFLYKSDDTFGGSNIYVEMPTKAVYSDVNYPPQYINLRIIPYDTNKDGKKELILIKNISSVGGVMSRIKLYVSSEVYNLEWDGLGFLENWKTRKINGYVADYQVKDIDNDGKDEIVMALVLSVGATLKTNSVVVSYKLLAQQP